MSLTFIEQIKHDFNESHLKYYSILLNFDGVWDFAVTKTPKIGQKITQKGGRVITCDPARTYPCGAVCRSHNKDCSNPIEGQARTYAGWLEKQAMTKYDQTVISLKKEIAFNTLSETGKLPKKGDSVYLIADVNRATGEPLLRDYIFVGLSKDKKTATLRPKSLTDDQKEIAKKNPSNFDRKVGADEVVVTDLTLDEAQKYFKEQNIASTTREREVREARSLKTENTKEINTVVRPRKPTKKDTPEPTIANRRKLTELPVEWKNLDSRVKEDIERNNRTNWGDVKVGDRVFDTNTQKYVTVNRKFSRHANATTEDGQKVKLQDYSAKKKSFDDLVLDTVDDLQTKREGQVKVDEKDKRPDSKVVEPTKKPQEQTDTKNKIISTDETLKDYATRLHGVDAALKKPEEIDAITKNYENAVISRIEKGDSIAPNLLRYGNLREYADKNGITDRLIDSVRKDVLGTYKPSARDLKDAAIGANKENPKSVDSQIKSLEESLAFQTYKNWQDSDPAKTKKQWEADLRYLTNVKNLQTAKSEPTKKPQEQTDTKKPDLKVVDGKNKDITNTELLDKFPKWVSKDESLKALINTKKGERIDIPGIMGEGLLLRVNPPTKANPNGSITVKQTEKSLERYQKSGFKAKQSETYDITLVRDHHERLKKAKEQPPTEISNKVTTIPAPEPKAVNDPYTSTKPPKDWQPNKSSDATTFKGDSTQGIVDKMPEIMSPRIRELDWELKQRQELQQNLRRPFGDPVNDPHTINAGKIMDLEKERFSEIQKEANRLIGEGKLKLPYWMPKTDRIPNHKPENAPEAGITASELEEADKRIKVVRGKYVPILLDSSGNDIGWGADYKTRKEALGVAIRNGRLTQAKRLGLEARDGYVVGFDVPEDWDTSVNGVKRLVKELKEQESTKKLGLTPDRRDFSEFTWSRENIEYFKNFKTPCRTILSY